MVCQSVIEQLLELDSTTQKSNSLLIMSPSMRLLKRFY